MHTQVRPSPEPVGETQVRPAIEPTLQKTLAHDPDATVRTSH